MKIAIVGTGYVGLVSGTCFAEMGLMVNCVDSNTEKIEALKRGEIPIYEPGLDQLIKKNKDEGRLVFHSSLRDCIGDISVLFIAVGTPSANDGTADLSYVYKVAEEIGDLMTQPLLIVTKSTVPVGTTHQVQRIIRGKLDGRGLHHLHFDIASNPEFLKEGAAIKDFMSPDRVIVGVESESAKEIMTKLYRPFLINNFRVIFMDILSSELTKYASNAMLATRISFMNELANLSEKLGADIELVRKGMGADKRIGTSFLYPGIGYGGSCFPKDVLALIQTARQHEIELQIVTKVHEANELQKHRPYEKLKTHLGDLKGKTIAIWGLSFKPETDDMRQAPSIILLDSLIKAGAVVKAFDPIAMDNARALFPEGIHFCSNIYETVEEADALVLLTEWKQFRLPNWERIQELMTGNLIIDGRNIFVPEELRELGFKYSGIGRS
ncbi:UDP-glucose/GDP-mannose dehydrogenase family protein [Porphyromonadaceae bacterium W3.11]|nr:UDP-glucose/GDP-mannose dehydrogenase family protein [Porphyromonadaceae bacterium W3.11]